MMVYQGAKYPVFYVDYHGDSASRLGSIGHKVALSIVILVHQSI